MAPILRRSIPAGLSFLAWAGFAVGLLLMGLEFLGATRGNPIRHGLLLTGFELLVYRPHSPIQVVWLLTCASLVLLGVACLRGWGSFRWPWMFWHGLLLSSFLSTSLTQPVGESFWLMTVGYGVAYAVAAVILFSRPARFFFASASPEPNAP